MSTTLASVESSHTIYRIITRYDINGRITELGKFLILTLVLKTLICSPSGPFIYLIVKIM